MSLKLRLITVAQKYAEIRRLSQSRVSKLVFGDGQVLRRLENDSDLTTGRFEGAMQWFSNNWPDDGEWPADVPRPPVSIASGA